MTQLAPGERENRDTPYHTVTIYIHIPSHPAPYLLTAHSHALYMSLASGYDTLTLTEMWAQQNTGVPNASPPTQRTPAQPILFGSAAMSRLLQEAMEMFQSCIPLCVDDTLVSLLSLVPVPASGRLVDG